MSSAQVAGAKSGARETRKTGIKRGGGGGKGSWGRIDDTGVGPAAVDAGDPLYDSGDDGMDSYVEEFDREAAAIRHGSDKAADAAAAADAALDAVVATADVISLRDYKAHIISAIKEYFSSEDVEELLVSLKSRDVPLFHYELVKRIVSMALDQHERGREMASRAISFLYGSGFLHSDQAAKGFERLFETVDDLALDAPHARDSLSRFVARAVADEVLPPAFLTDPSIVAVGGDVVTSARALLRQRHAGARMEQVWGAGSARSVAKLKLQMRQLLGEFVDTSDAGEALRCLRDLRVPHFHHEAVKRAFVLAADRGDEDCDKLAGLLAQAVEEGVVTQQQLRRGLQRCVRVLPDVTLDAPRAPEVLKRMTRTVAAAGKTPEGLVEEVEAGVAAAMERKGPWEGEDGAAAVAEEEK